MKDKNAKKKTKRYLWQMTVTKKMEKLTHASKNEDWKNRVIITKNRNVNVVA